ncbi:anti-anti-sigma regulatory factor [Peribacillus deserti]|uniref:Anti-anti-sigma regulatory factor n=1 Tax=Peribacillus deserti TaxID=673318 RepID=A0ABS2QL94_9BACI|nr:STAS domain-containing protein [Peribacillus deserti]MBM7693943.1 anti-anti-sigma regulatory factor [Peribacillus deserti]
MSDSKVHIKVHSNEFVWDKAEGLVTFDGAPALLFWDSAIELFLKTIEEVSGKDVSTTVFEATGFRMGHLVSSYYAGRTDFEEILLQYSDIYRNAGWGNVNISYFSIEEKRVTVQLTNSWEHRIFKSMDKEQAGVLLPSHWAGVFSGLFNENMWYKTAQSQLAGNSYDEIEIFASSITPSKNIHNLTRQKERQYITELESKVNQRTEELTSLVKDLSSPVIPVLKDILVIPLMGTFNDERFEDLIQKALFEISRHQAKYLLIDLTAINTFDDFTIEGLKRLIGAVRLLGGTCILVGIAPSLSVQMVHSQVDMNGIQFFSTLQHGVQYALEQNGYDITPKKEF